MAHAILPVKSAETDPRIFRRSQRLAFAYTRINAKSLSLDLKWKQKYEIFCGVQIQALIVDVILDKSSIVSDASGSSRGATCYIESMNLGIGSRFDCQGERPHTFEITQLK